jgi:hypothetical protein
MLETTQFNILTDTARNEHSTILTYHLIQLLKTVGRSIMHLFNFY